MKKVSEIRILLMSEKLPSQLVSCDFLTDLLTLLTQR